MRLKTVWSLEAISEFEIFYNYWIEKNGSDTYSKKIWYRINKAVEIIEVNPKLGIPTNHSDIKMRLILSNHYLIYKIRKESIEILKFWDVRQNPHKNRYTPK